MGRIQRGMVSLPVKPQSESDTQALILIYVTSLPQTFAYRMNTGAASDGSRFVKYGIPGQPDIFACIRGRFVGIEAKTAVGRQSEKQKIWQRNLERAGGIYILARSVDDVRVRLEMEGLV